MAWQRKPRAHPARSKLGRPAPRRPGRRHRPRRDALPVPVPAGAVVLQRRGVRQALPAQPGAAPRRCALVATCGFPGRLRLSARRGPAAPAHALHMRPAVRSRRACRARAAAAGGVAAARALAARRAPDGSYRPPGPGPDRARWGGAPCDTARASAGRGSARRPRGGRGRRAGAGGRLGVPGPESAAPDAAVNCACVSRRAWWCPSPWRWARRPRWRPRSTGRWSTPRAWAWRARRWPTAPCRRPRPRRWRATWWRASAPWRASATAPGPAGAARGAFLPAGRGVWAVRGACARVHGPRGRA